MSNKLSFSNLKNAVSGSISEYSLIATKGIALTMAGLVLTVGLSTNSLVASAAKDNTPRSYEAMLSVELQPNTTTKDLAKAIKADVGNLNDVDIMSLSSKLDFEGKTQTFTKSNEDQLKTQKLLDSYSKSQNAFLTTLVNFKDQTDKGQTIENQEAIKPLLNKYSKSTLKSTETKYKTKTPVVSSVVIGGSLVNLNKLNAGKVKDIAVKAEVTNLKELEKLTSAIKIKVEKATSIEEKTKILNEGINDITHRGDTAKPFLLDDGQLQIVDSLKRFDIGGNIYINQSEVKSKLGLTDAQVNDISKAMTNYNQMPQEIKDNSSNATQAVVQTTQLKTEEYNQKDLGEKIGQLIIGSVKTEAASQNPGDWRASAWFNNYGNYADSYLWINQDLTNAISNGLSNLAKVWLGVVAARGCAYVGAETAIIGGLACGVIAYYLIEAMVYWYQSTLQYLWNCSNGVYIKIRSQNSYLTLYGPNCW